jgi:magnesium transporter
VTDPAAVRAGVGPGTVTWLDVQGLGDETLLRRIGEAFDIHPLALEDLVNAPQRPKAEDYASHLLLITRMARLVEDDAVEVEQVGLVVGDRFVLSFQERPGDVLNPVRRRLREGVGPMRSSGPDYLAYALVDTIVDAYYPLIEVLSERLERIEGRVASATSPRVLERLNRIKVDLLLIRRAIWPQQETLNRLLREPSRFITDDVRVYLRDTHDHCAQLSDVVDSHRELVTTLMSTHLALIGNRTNEVMRVLTVMASIFIPLTFLAGLYGMNFPNMPEFTRPWAYPVLLAVMGVMVVVMLTYFRRRGWLGGGDDDRDDD